MLDNFQFQINWYGLILLVITILFTVTNIMLVYYGWKDTKNKPKFIALYSGLEVATLIGVIILWFLESKIKLFNEFITFLNNVINGALNRLPITWIFIWIIIPTLICYAIFAVRGTLYYAQKKISFDKATSSDKPKEKKVIKHKKEEIKAVLPDFKEFINYDEIKGIAGFRKFIKASEEQAMFASYANFNWIAINDKKQYKKIAKKFLLPKIDEFPVLFKGKDGKFDAITASDAIIEVRKYVRANRK